jgi:hypothetical protein
MDLDAFDKLKVTILEDLNNDFSARVPKSKQHPLLSKISIIQ